MPKFLFLTAKKGDAAFNYTLHAEDSFQALRIVWQKGQAPEVIEPRYKSLKASKETRAQALKKLAKKTRFTDGAAVQRAMQATAIRLMYQGGL